VKASDLAVGEEVILRDVNERGAVFPRGTVVKVGRTLVTIKDRYGEQQYRIEEQHKNDQWQHGWFQTMDQYEAEQRHSAARDTLCAHGFTLAAASVDRGKVQAVAEFLRREYGDGS
jgi:hypothetical protein